MFFDPWPGGPSLSVCGVSCLGGALLGCSINLYGNPLKWMAVRRKCPEDQKKRSFSRGHVEGIKKMRFGVGLPW